jgi:hypothetical protein
VSFEPKLLWGEISKKPLNEAGKTLEYLFELFALNTPPT